MSTFFGTNLHTVTMEPLQWFSFLKIDKACIYNILIIIETSNILSPLNLYRRLRLVYLLFSWTKKKVKDMMHLLTKIEF